MFDPYHKWLGIPPGQRPPTYYQLLGIDPAEMDAEVIKEAALRQTARLRGYQTGPHAELCTRVLNEIAQARAVLLNPKARQEYDAQHAGPPDTPAAPPAGPPPPPAGRPPALPPLLGQVLAAAGYALLLLLGFAASFWLTYDALHSAARLREPAGKAGRATPGERGP